jgi:hypothetical protein
MQKNISATMFYSLLFAMGGAPTIAMMIIRAQTQNPEVIYAALIGLSVIIACVLVPIILLQNSGYKKTHPEMGFYHSSFNQMKIKHQTGGEEQSFLHGLDLLK